MTLGKIISKVYRKFINSTFQKIRILFYISISEIKIKGVKVQPVLSHGEGKIYVANNVVFGVEKSAEYYTSYIYIEARCKESIVKIGEQCIINNSLTLICEGKEISIGDNCLIGSNVQMIDSDFHELNPQNRFGGKHIKRKEIIVGNNVFIGNDVTILKGVHIGNNSVIGNHSVVTKSIPNNVVVAGNPAKVIRPL